MSIAIHEDIRLKERECKIKVVAEGGAYSPDISVDNTETMHILQTACYFQQLAQGL